MNEKEINIDCLPNNFKQCFKLTEILKNNDLGFDLEYNIGKGKNKKEAEQSAAKEAIMNLTMIR